MNKCQSTVVLSCKEPVATTIIISHRLASHCLLTDIKSSSCYRMQIHWFMNINGDG